MNFEKFMDAVTDMEHIANEFMNGVTIQVTKDAKGQHKALFMMAAPYSDKTREFTVVPSPYAVDELLIEIDVNDGSHFNASAEGLYKFLWHSAESDFAKTDKALKKLMQPYDIASDE